MLAALASRSTRLVATGSSSPRALPARALADAASRHFAEVECVPDPVEALSARAHELGDPVLVTGSLYLLVDLRRPPPGPTMAGFGDKLTVFAFAAFLLAAFVGLAFAAGYVIGKLLL